MSHSNQAVKTLYEDVMNDVIRNMKQEFENEGVDDHVLGELEALWRNKLDESGALSDTPGEPAYYDPHYTVTYPHNQPQQQVQYTTQYGLGAQQAATAYVPPQPAVDPYSQLQYSAQMFAQQQQQQPQVPSTVTAAAQAVASQMGMGGVGQRMVGAGGGQVAPPQANLPQQQPQYGAYPQQYYAATQQNLAQQANSQYYVTNVYQQYNKQPQLPQTDGPADDTTQLSPDDERRLADQMLARMCMEREAARQPKKGNKTTSEIPQLDGVNVNASGRQYQDLDSENLGSDLDEPDEDDGDEDSETDHLVLCQFDKVTRNKNKWKVVLKDGVMHLNNRDYVFHKANGDFEW
eukprot:comp20674_c0_seq1/m.26848 comp20674_c0_seq1/g.26848  ORF comp20674_c0_seq1/g.26848 comp20674_c0_seq1/m.26848 type:complete len:348 (-) comp20674_c0_seq1:36-1079(-)